MSAILNENLIHSRGGLVEVEDTAWVGNHHILGPEARRVAE
jgi:hypothetical protein